MAITSFTEEATIAVKSATKTVEADKVVLNAHFDVLVGGKVLTNIYRTWNCSQADEPFQKAVDLLQEELLS